MKMATTGRAIISAFCIIFDYFLALASRPEAQVALELDAAPLPAGIEPRLLQLSTVKIRCVEVETLTLADNGFRLASKQVDIARTRKSINLCEINFPRFN